MVCLPCILLPIALIVYLKVIQPLLLMILPASWRSKVDAWLYPTCPLQQPPVTKQIEQSDDHDKCDENTKKTI
ncbi:hypothetical protein M514_06019 [Trichuris suis]|uniref:Uncharacterized protein n=1 Tax=Trichuris suis TaxID=68888 RepID=A0A085M7A9_9BILA|nr:hypothetical protein M513_06019 [Trichuris suis]KFD70749.1 hypothetical protein M514_06019 [Trichuris suis]KHJ43758.1 hypothetical protein D918_06263 [Trichuris suis]